jgi:sirohydrochlorin ferrochelatase
VKWCKDSSDLTLLSNGFGSASYLSRETVTVKKNAPWPVCFLFDNGSLRAASTLQLRLTAAMLNQEIGAPVEAVSLLHSSGVDPAALNGVPARLLEPALQTFLEHNPEGEAVLLPFFFGPSAALVEYVPERIAALQKKFPLASLRLASCLVRLDEPDSRVAEALADTARDLYTRKSLERPAVVLVDHGSPRAEVTAIRDRLGAEVRKRLGDVIRAFGVASMERRPGPEFAFNDPLLAACLRTAPFDRGDVVVLTQFLSPGRHAGPDGDIAQICAQARAERPELRTWQTEPIGTDPRVIAVLADRYRQTFHSSFFGSIKPTSSA